MRYCSNCKVLLSEECVRDLERRGMPCPGCRRSNYFPTVGEVQENPFYKRTNERIKTHDIKIEVNIRGDYEKT